MEMASNLQVSFFDLKVRHKGSQSSIFVRTLRAFTKGRELHVSSVAYLISYFAAGDSLRSSPPKNDESPRL